MQDSIVLEAAETYRYDSKSRRIKAKKSGSLCGVCQKEIHPPSLIFYNPDLGPSHEACVEAIWEGMDGS